MRNGRLDHADVAFMYYPHDPDAFVTYGATICAWGGADEASQVAAARAPGVHPTVSMWCLTAGAKQLHDSPALMHATVRDIW